MKRLLQIITVGFILSGLLSAQDPTRDHLSVDAYLDFLRRQLAFHELEDSRAGIDREIALRRHARYVESLLLARMNRFVVLWSALANEYNEKQTFNYKLAGEVAKAFHELEKSEGWPRQK